MKHFFSSILLTMFLCMFGAKAYAYDIAVDNADGVTIYYNIINDDKELEVTYLQDYDDYAFDFKWDGFDDVYVGSVVIPEEVTYLDVIMTYLAGLSRIQAEVSISSNWMMVQPKRF